VGKPLVAAAAMGGAAWLLLPLGRGWALLGALLVYPLVAWRVGLLAPEERAVLTPLLKRA